MSITSNRCHYYLTFPIPNLIFTQVSFEFALQQTGEKWTCSLLFYRIDTCWNLHLLLKLRFCETTTLSDETSQGRYLWLSSDFLSGETRRSSLSLFSSHHYRRSNRRIVNGEGSQRCKLLPYWLSEFNKLNEARGVVKWSSIAFLQTNSKTTIKSEWGDPQRSTREEVII